MEPLNHSRREGRNPPVPGHAAKPRPARPDGQLTGRLAACRDLGEDLGRLLRGGLDQAVIRLSIRESIRESGPLQVNVRGGLVAAGSEPVRVPLATVAAPRPTIFPNGLPPASIPAVRASA